MKIKKWKAILKENNQGFTLVELLISIAMLAIIVYPILNNFVASARTNFKSRETQQTTALANSMMEAVKAEDTFVGLASMFLYDHSGRTFDLIDGVVSPNQTVELVNNHNGTYSLAENPCVNEAYNTGSNEYEYTLKKNSDNIYYFAINELPYNNKSYDVLITYDGSVYEKAEEEGKTGINEQGLFKMSSVASEENAIISAGSSATTAATRLLQKYKEWGGQSTQNQEITLNKIQENLECNIEITIDYKQDQEKYTVSADYIYTLKNLVPTASSNQWIYTESTYTSVFQSLEEIYLFFTPNLALNYDQITVNNNIPTEFHPEISINLVEQQQQNSDYINRIPLYQLKMSIHEPYSAKKQLDGVSYYNTSIRHNLASTCKTVDGDRLLVFNNGTIDTSVQLKSLLEVEEDSIRLYKITVQVFDTKAAISQKYQLEDLLCSFSSTKGEQ